MLLGRLFRFYSSLNVAKSSVKDALTCSHLVGKQISVHGWVKSVRKQKHFLFVSVNDGSTSQNLQVVAPTERFPNGSDLSRGCSVVLEGELMVSPNPNQPVELKPSTVTLVGKCAKEYPFKAHTKHSLDYVRQFPHLRPRTNLFAALLRIRNAAVMSVHAFFQGRSFLHLDAPILTSLDCEGAGQLFQVVLSRDLIPLTQYVDERKKEFFGRPVFLTVSGQLHAEAAVCGMSKVYTTGPTFRAEKSHTHRHLAEFTMVEAEMVTEPAEQGLGELLQVAEDLCKHVVETIVSQSQDDLDLFRNSCSRLTLAQTLLDNNYKRMSYSEAIDILLQAHDTGKEAFEFVPKWGDDLQSEHEHYLLNYCGNLPVFITEFPEQLKPFYARTANKGNACLAMDLLLPGVGEVVGGSMREERLDILEQKLQRLQSSKDYEWYLDLRRFGTVHHGGFGLGFDRLLQAILGIQNIRDVVTFPRFLGSCDI